MNLPITFYELWLPIIICAIITLVLLILYLVSYVKDKRDTSLKLQEAKQFYGDSVPLIIAFMMVCMTTGIMIYTIYLK